jgi:hypothetical protein
LSYVNRTRLFATGVVASLTLAALPAALAQGATAPAEARLEILAARAPLALSGDGAWRLHVDSHDLLHRVSLADTAHESTVQLPAGVQALAASGDGRRVALSTNRQCTGLVDFGAHDGDAATVTWRPVLMSSNGTPLGPQAGPWLAQMPADCGAHEPAPPVAISSDGRWIATPDVVVDASTSQVVASLPADFAYPLRLQFIDHDTRLLVARAHLGDHPEGPPDASRLSFSVWDLASKALVNDIEVTGTELATRASLLVDVSAQTGALFFLDDRARSTDHALALTQLAPGTCGAPPRVRSRVGDDIGPSFAIDPYGRWIAWARPLHATRNQAEWDAGLRSELVVRDLAGGRVLARTTSRFVLAGVVATPDGHGLFALGSHAIDANTGEWTDGATTIPDADQLVRIDVGDAIATLPRDAVNVPAAGFCREPGETPGARTPARAERLLTAVWSHDLGADVAPAPETDGHACAGMAPAPTSFRTPEGGFWFDIGAQVERIDLATGMIATALPTPRKKGVCSVVSSTGTGFFNVTGDTLTWRPLAAADDPARRRVLERRPGWVARLTPDIGTGTRVTWQASEAKRDERAAAGENHDVIVTTYDANGKRIALESTTTEDARVEGAGADFDAAGRLREPSAPCHDAGGVPIAIGYDWRAGPFGSWRGMTCGPLPGAARLIWWSGATIAPRAPAFVLANPLAAIDGAIAAVADDAQIHVVNLALQREFAQIALAGRNADRVWLLANRRLVVVQSTAADGHAWLHAYALP